VYIDFSDGNFYPKLLFNLAHSYLPSNLIAYMHLMYKRPHDELETVMSLKPNLVIIHAEAEGELDAIVLRLQSVGIKAGVALLQDTKPEDHAELLSLADHILIFSGDLGHYGGKADLTLLTKASTIRGINATAELGWDGGVSIENAPLLMSGGIEILDVGGGIQRVDDPAGAYASLVKVTQS
jgi:ribulose-phosphate 3-epimerase